MTSILFPTGSPLPSGGPSEATADLHLDEVFVEMLRPVEEFDLKALLYTPLTDANEIRFRQAIFHDLETHPRLGLALEGFTSAMGRVRRRLRGLGELRSHRQRQGWFLDAAEAYCRCALELLRLLRETEVTSEGLCSTRATVEGVCESEAFDRLLTDATDLRRTLSAIRYSVTIDSGRVDVEPHDGAPDEADVVIDHFERFRQRASVERLQARSPRIYLNSVDAQVLDRVAALNPGAFADLDAFCERHAEFIHPAVAEFDREIRFYLAVHRFIVRLRSSGLPVCYPTIDERGRALDAVATFDIALGNRLADAGKVVTNDLALHDGEQMLVITGPNQGGKTTTARLFGQIHYLASLGVPVPGRAVHVALFDQIFTHFERREDLRRQAGKLEDELQRLHLILDHATERSIVVMNESFSSTSLRDARLLGTAAIRQLLDLGTRGVFVTFVDELASLDAAVVSMVSAVDPNDPTVRTFKVERRPADGRAYARSLAERHGLTYEQLRSRLSA